MFIYSEVETDTVIVIFFFPIDFFTFDFCSGDRVMSLYLEREIERERDVCFGIICITLLCWRHTT